MSYPPLSIHFVFIANLAHDLPLRIIKIKNINKNMGFILTNGWIQLAICEFTKSFIMIMRPAGYG